MPPAESARGDVLIVEDDRVMGGSLVQRLRLEGFAVRWAMTGGAARELVAQQPPDALLCDIRLPDIDGEALFTALRPGLHDAAVLMMTAYADIDQAVRLVRAGADDFLVKPFATAELLSRLDALLARRLVAPEAAVLGGSPALRRIEAVLRRVAPADSPVLLLGETGVGKEVAARLLHDLDRAARGPFMAVNCAAIPAELMESEVFGHERGAFTGAAQRHAGFAERAASGTLFLDEVGELAPPLQAKLLRLLEAREFQRVGGRETLRFRARIVAASNADLAARVREGRFRDDLLYRLDVIRVEIPPLRARPQDVLPLARRFLGALAERQGGAPRGFEDAAAAVLLAHQWPGNARELRNRVERAAAFADAAWLSAEVLFPELGATPVALESVLPTLSAAIAAAERRAIEAALDATGGDVTAAAERLGIGRSTLFEKLRRLRIGRFASPEDGTT